MTTLSRSQSELKRFRREYLDSRQVPREIATARRKFDAMADVELMMWLQLGAELGVFEVPAAEQMFREHRVGLLESLSYVERTKNYSKLFRGEVDIFANQIRTRGIPFVEHPDRLSHNLFVSGSTEILFHEVGRSFRDGDMTAWFDFVSAQEFREQLKEKPDPEAFLRGDILRGTDLVLNEYLEFLRHAGGLLQLWEYLGSVSESSYAISTLRQRVSAMHNWRLDLLRMEVRERFDEVTEILIEGVTADPQLHGLGIEASELLPQIEAVCSSWNGGDTHSAGGVGAEGGSEDSGGRQHRQAELREKKKPRRAA